MIRDIAIVMRGTLIAQALGFVVLPVLARLFQPAAFGNYQLFTAILTFLLVFPTMRYEIAILRARGMRELRALVQLCAFLILIVSFIFAALMLLLSALGWPPLLDRLPFPTWLMALSLLFGGAAQCLAILVTREKAFSTSARSKILQSTSYIGASLGIGAVNPVPAGLIVADLAGRIANSLYLVRWSMRNLPRLWTRPRRQELAAVARRYREYPYISAPGTLINVTGGILTPIMIYASFNAAASGQFALLDRSVNLPLGLVVISVAQVFTAQFSAELVRDPAAAAAHFRQTLRYLALLAVPPMLVLIVAGPWLFALVFGEQWRLAGELGQLMAPAFGSLLIAGPLHMVLTVMGYQKLQTAWEIGRLAVITGLWLLISRFGLPLKVAVAGYSGVIVLTSVAFVLLAYANVPRGRGAAPVRAQPVDGP
jgi:teichuronic acid exporter